MRKPQTKAEWQALCNELTDDLAELSANGFALLKRERNDTEDGYPRNSLPEGPGGSGHGDPVGDLVVNAIAGKVKVQEKADSLWHSVIGARGHLLTAFKAMVDGLGMQKPEQVGDSNPGCVNCAAYGRWTVVEVSGRCSACRRYRSRHGRDRPRDLIVDRAEQREVGHHIVPGQHVFPGQGVV